MKDNKVLISGLVLWILGFITNLLIPNSNDFTIPFLPVASDLFHGTNLLLIILIMPALEELAFRGWTIKGTFWKLVSIILGLLFIITWAIDGSTLIIFTTIGLFLAGVFFARRGGPIFRILASSFFFTICHLQLSNFINFSNLIQFFQTFGFGIVMSFVALRFNVWSSFFIHAFNNGAILLIIQLVVMSEFPKRFNYSINGEPLRAEIIPFWELKSKSNQNDSIVVLNGNILEIAASLITDGSIIEDTPESSLIRARIEVPAKYWVDSNKVSLLNEWFQSHNLVPDTSIVDAYTLKRTDLPLTPSARMSISEFRAKAYSEASLPIYYASNESNSIAIPVLRIFSKDRLLEFYREHAGYDISSTPDTTIHVLRLKKM